jgi:hypothetical protein
VPFCSDTAEGAIFYTASGENWTGWALINARDIASMPPPFDPARILCWLESLHGYEKVRTALDLRCGTQTELWQAHRDLQAANLANICHAGLEVSTGVWIAGNVSIAPTAEIVAPTYIGENSRIDSGARIGPFAVIGSDCLIAQGAIVRNAVVCPGTYAGSHVELDHVLVNKRLVFDVRHGASVDRVDDVAFDGIFDYHLPAALRRARSFLASTLTARARMACSARSDNRLQPTIHGPSSRP